MSGDSANTMLLADVGGTNTRVAIANSGSVDRARLMEFPNAEFGGLWNVLIAYLNETGARPDVGAVAVAGPVRDGEGELANLAWAFDEARLSAQTGVGRINLLNDLQAQGHALDHLDAAMVRCVVKGSGYPAPGQARLVIGIGTGFNAAPVFEAPGGRLVVPSECGHLTLPQESDEHRDLARWFDAELGFASVEDAVSGRGLEALYRWDGHGGPATKLGLDIMSGLADGSDARAAKTVRLFVDLLAAAAGNLALTHLPYGGIYLIGGMARAVAPYFERFDFTDRFCAKGQLRSLMEEFSVHVVEDDFAALNGCASFLAQRA